MKIDDLKFDDKNFNKGTKQGKSLLQKSLQKFVAGRSILVDKNNRVIAGNKTLENFSEIGSGKIEVIETNGDTLVVVKRSDIDLDSPEGREMALADNRTSEIGLEWDMYEIKSELDEAEMLMNDTNDEVGDDMILWFWNRYKDQKKSTIIHNIAIE